MEITDKMIERACIIISQDLSTCGGICPDPKSFEDYVRMAARVFKAAISTDAGRVRSEPYGYAFQHEDTGFNQIVDVQQVEWGFEKNNPRWQKIGPVYLHQPFELKAAPALAVKALEWTDKQAQSILGPYWIASASKQYLYLGNGKGLGSFDTVEEAKAAAQADYEARIRSALA